MTNNTVVNTIAATARTVGTKVEQGVDQVKDTTTTGIDMVKGAVDKHTYSRTKDETIHAKGGTVTGFDEAEAMVTNDPQSDAERRFSEVEDLLFRKDAKGGPKLREGTLDLFNKITPRLAGGGVMKDWATRATCDPGGMDLKHALGRASRASTATPATTSSTCSSTTVCRPGRCRSST